MVPCVASHTASTCMSRRVGRPVAHHESGRNDGRRLVHCKFAAMQQPKQAGAVCLCGMCPLARNKNSKNLHGTCCLARCVLHVLLHKASDPPGMLPPDTQHTLAGNRVVVALPAKATVTAVRGQGSWQVSTLGPSTQPRLACWCTWHKLLHRHPGNAMHRVHVQGHSHSPAAKCLARCGRPKALPQTAGEPRPRSWHGTWAPPPPYSCSIRMPERGMHMGRAREQKAGHPPSQGPHTVIPRHSRLLRSCGVWQAMSRQHPDGTGRSGGNPTGGGGGVVSQGTGSSGVCLSCQRRVVR